MIAYICPNPAGPVQHSGICGDSQLKSLKAWDAPAYPVVHHFVYTASMRRTELASESSIYCTGKVLIYVLQLQACVVHAAHTKTIHSILSVIVTAYLV
jgi:hypothetical protein